MPINSIPEEAGLGFANVDLQRLARQGGPEVVYGAGKTAAQIAEILKALRRAVQSPVLVTRLDAEKAAAVAAAVGPDFAYLADGRLDLSAVITHRFPLKNAEKALQTLTSHKEFCEKVMLSTEEN